MSTQDALGLVLLQQGTITQAQLYEAMQLQQRTNRQLGTCLLQLGFVAGQVVLAAQSQVLDIPALPPGMLFDASPEALRRVPAAVANRLRIVPYSWDGTVLGVALGDGRVIEHLAEVAEHANAAIGAYVVLESEIDQALVLLYPPEPQSVAPRVYKGLPPPVVQPAQGLTRTSFYDATGQLYEAKTIDNVAQCIGAALLNYFRRVLLFRCEAAQLRLLAFAGCSTQRKIIPLQELVSLQQTYGLPPLKYGLTRDDPRMVEITDALRLEAAHAALLAFAGPAAPPDLLVYADNGDATELYEDLHDVESLLREATTAMGMPRPS